MKKSSSIKVIVSLGVVILVVALSVGLGLRKKNETKNETCASKTCNDCSGIGCTEALCSSSPVKLGPKSDFWPPEEIFQQPSGPNPMQPNFTAEYYWFKETVLDQYPKLIKQEDTKYALTDKEISLVKMGLSEWMKERAVGTYTCLEMATALTKRAQYLQHVQSLNNFMYWNSFDWVSVVLDQAKKLDDLASTEGSTSVLAPLYCYPIPLKGTMATTDFPSSLGFAALYDKFAVKDAALTSLIKEAKGVQFGKTNVPEHAHSWGTGNYHNGLCFNPWDYDMMTGGSSGGSGAAVASYTATIAITEDTEGSTNTPATRNHLFGYDPPKFHYPNAGNPSLAVRNDQLGVNARHIDDIIAFDEAVLGTVDAHKAAKFFVDSLSNSDITIGCSDVYYDYDLATPAIKAKFGEAKKVLEKAGFKMVKDCQEDNPMVEVPRDDNPYAVWYDELETHIHVTLGLPDMNPWDVLLNGFYDFGSTLSAGWMYNYVTEGCAVIDQDNDKMRSDYLGPVPIERSKVYNRYFDEKKVDLLMGPAQVCDKVIWTEDIGGAAGINEGCDGRFAPGCMWACHTMGVLGSRDKTFTKAKFVVPIGLTQKNEHFSLHFMSRAGPYDTDMSPEDWIYDEVGPQTWNLEELYMIKRITSTLEAAGLRRADATMNFISGLLPEPKVEECPSLTCGECPNGCVGGSCGDSAIVLPPKSDFWPPEEIFQYPYGPNAIPANLTAEYNWWIDTVIKPFPVAMKQSESEYALTTKETELVKMSLTDWIMKRKAGVYTCEDLAKALTKRAQYLQYVQHMNHFMYWESFNWVPKVIEQAQAYDLQADEDGIESISPLYCYPIPLKGTMATVDFPSSLGFAALHYHKATKDAELVTLMKEANGVLFGKTNVPEHAHSYGTGNYANGIAFNPWSYDMMTGGSSGGSGAAVASYTAAIAITEDTYGSTNTPATRNHLFGYDPPKFHYPNGGNPSLTYRNDQLGVNARSFDDILTFDYSVLDTYDEHMTAKAYVDGLENSDITIGCSPVFYDYDAMPAEIKSKYYAAETVLMEAGFTFVKDTCLDKNPVNEVPYPESASAAWYAELENHVENTLGIKDFTTWDVLLNGAYDFGTSLSFGWFYSNTFQACPLINQYNEEAKKAYLGHIPANRSEVYNEYFDEQGVDLLMGPTQICNYVLWSEDIGGPAGINAGCDGGKFDSRCMSSCHTLGVRGSFDKTFTKAKFVVPIGLTEIDQPFSLHFMSRAGPRNPTVPPIEWVFDEEGPQTWNLVEMYMVQRIAKTLEEAGMGRADANMEYVSDLGVVDTGLDIQK